MTQKPLFILGPSKIHGTGVILAKALPKDALIDVAISYSWGFFPYVTTHFGKWINHSYTPNTRLVYYNDEYWIQTIRALPAGTEITTDYRHTPWYIRKPEPHWK